MRYASDGSHFDEMQTPCYVIHSDGMRESVSYRDDWCYGKSEWLANTGGDSGHDAREIIKSDIRATAAHFAERNGIPVYFVSDHGNINRTRAIRLRRR